MISKKKLIIGCLIAFFIFILLVVGFFVWLSYDLNEMLENNNQAARLPNETMTPVVDPGVRWIEPQKVDDLKLLKIGTTYNEYKSVEYFKIGEIQNGEIIFAKATLNYEYQSADYYRFKKESGKYYYLAKASSPGDNYSLVSRYFTTDTIIFDKTEYKSLQPPEYLSVKDKVLEERKLVGICSGLKGAQEVDTTPWGIVYKTITPSSNKETATIQFSLKLADSTCMLYYVDFPAKSNSGVPYISWNDTGSNDDYFSSSTPYCADCDGDNFAVFNLKNIEQRLQVAGEGDGGLKVYTVDRNDPLMQAAYTGYKNSRDNPMSLDNFLQVHPFFVTDDGLGDWLIFTNSDYSYNDRESDYEGEM